LSSSSIAKRLILGGSGSSSISRRPFPSPLASSFATTGMPNPPAEISLTDAEWKKRLTPQEYRVSFPRQLLFCGASRQNRNISEFACQCSSI